MLADDLFIIVLFIDYIGVFPAQVIGSLALNFFIGSHIGSHMGHYDLSC